MFPFWLVIVPDSGRDGDLQLDVVVFVVFVVVVVVVVTEDVMDAVLVSVLGWSNSRPFAETATVT
jgi:hypothetical protein